MSKPTAPPPAPGFVTPGVHEAPPSYNQAMGVGPQAPFHPQPPMGGGVVFTQPRGNVGVPAATMHPQWSQHHPTYPTPAYPTMPQYPTAAAAAVSPMQTMTVVTTVVPPGPNSTHTVCPHCHAEIDSQVKTTPSMMAWISGTLIALLGCWMGCCLIPCCIDECLDRDHFCPNCRAFLGRFQR